MLVKIFSQTCKLDEFWTNFLKPEELKLVNFWKFETRKTQTRTPKRQLKSNLKKSKPDQALLFKTIQAHLIEQFLASEFQIKFLQVWLLSGSYRF